MDATSAAASASPADSRFRRRRRRSGSRPAPAAPAHRARCAPRRGASAPVFCGRIAHDSALRHRCPQRDEGEAPARARANRRDPPCRRHRARRDARRGNARWSTPCTSQAIATAAIASRRHADHSVTTISARNNAPTSRTRCSSYAASPAEIQPRPSGKSSKKLRGANAAWRPAGIMSTAIATSDHRAISDRCTSRPLPRLFPDHFPGVRARHTDTSSSCRAGWRSRFTPPRSARRAGSRLDQANATNPTAASAAQRTCARCPLWAGLDPQP